MDGDQIARLLYLGLLGAALAGILVASQRQNLGRMAQQAAVWALIFLGAVAAAGLWSDIRDDVAPRQTYLGDGRIEVPRGPGGHYDLTVEVNEVPVRFVVDTGATDIVLTHEDAERAGVDIGGLIYGRTGRTANGTVQVASVRLDEVRVGDVVDRDVRASVTDGELDRSLLGMRYLERFERVSIEDGRLVLER